MGVERSFNYLGPVRYFDCRNMGLNCVLVFEVVGIQLVIRNRYYSWYLSISSFLMVTLD